MFLQVHGNAPPKLQGWGWSVWIESGESGTVVKTGVDAFANLVINHELPENVDRMLGKPPGLRELRAALLDMMRGRRDRSRQ